MTDLVIRNVAVLDCTGAQPGRRRDVTVADGRIASIEAPGKRPARPGVTSINGAGCTLMPGLTDAHVHFALIGRSGDHGDGPWIEHVLAVRELIGEALDAGFTTVRDAGGLEPTWARLVERGRVRGPRILPSGSPLSQTGGHGDARLAHEHVHGSPTFPGLFAASEIVDGVDSVRRAAREQLRRGATQIKVFASGGLASPTDPLESLQFTVEEMAAAVEVANAWRTYVLAHCHTSPAIENALAAGVRSIEHASMLTEHAAARIKEQHAFMVPTLQTLESLVEHPADYALTPEKQALADMVYRSATESVRLGQSVGASIGSGSDLIGPVQPTRGREIVLKAAILGAHEAIISATRTNAELFGLADRIGTIEPGKDADLILVEGEPLDDVSVLEDPGCIAAVIKGGEVMKDSAGRASV